MNKKFNQLIIKKNLKIKDALKKLQFNRSKILCLVNQNNKLIGVINDGDIRRGFIKNLSLNDSIEKILNKKPITLQLKNINQIKIQNLFKLGIDAIPILKNKKLVDIIIS
jgi:predicted transcriptional regulator